MFTISQISSILNGSIDGDSNLIIKGICDLQNSKNEHISYINSKKYEVYFKSTKASAILVDYDFNIDRNNKTLIRVKNPKLSFIDLIKIYHPEKKIINQKHTLSLISKNTQLSNNIEIGPNVIISAKSIIKSHVAIGANTYIGENCIIESGSIIKPNVTIYNDVEIGKNCIIESGSVIGSDGFGLVSDKGIHHKIPHIGTVKIHDDVWIGANCTIDKGTIDSTIINSGSKLDNQIHIAHNVKIGKNCIIAAQVAIAGSTIVEDNVTIAGQVGIVGHLVIGQNSIIASKSAVYQSLDPHSFVSGIPARHHKNRLRQDVLINKLPDILNRIRKIENKLFKK